MTLLDVLFIDRTRNVSVGDGTEGQKCLPHVSTYTDCTPANICDGCEKCTCSADAKWICETVRECGDRAAEKGEDMKALDEDDVDTALQMLLHDMEALQEKDAAKKTNSPLVPSPSKFDSLIDYEINQRKHMKFEDFHKIDTETEEEDTILDIISGRSKRSVKVNKSEKDNGTVIFHHTIDELNEDTLKNTNISGTLIVSKIDAIPQPSRRSSLAKNSSTEALQIEYTPPINNQHVGDNKVDTPAIHDDKEDLLVHHKVFQMIGNKSQTIRDKDLSKLVVNELKVGEETIGDKNASVISNITFTSENDTLTAMAFIAGNLLNKLWNIEKDVNDNPLETETMKHKKINELLELFKEPLNLRQETFLKNALESLSSAIENKNIENISICHDIEEFKKKSSVASEPVEVKLLSESKYVNSDEQKPNQSTATADALSKISSVLDLIKKYEHVQNSLIDKKFGRKSEDIYNKDQMLKSMEVLSKEEKSTLDVFGSILKTLTKILIPNSSGKKLLRGINSRYLFSKDKDIREKLSRLNLSDKTITAKDRLIIDYLNHIQNNPSCLLNKQKQEKPALPNLEGGILLNLSEFLKIKSMRDLLQLVDSKKMNEESLMMRSEKTTTPVSLKSTTNILFYNAENDYITTETNSQSTDKNKVTQFEATKEKLKSHLKTILEDLIELQAINGNGKSAQGIEIAEALPCIYNLLDSKKGTNVAHANKKEKPNKLALNPLTKVTDIFDKLKKELKRTSQTRRSNLAVVPIGPRPKSAIVWERTIKNLVKKQKPATRRNLAEKGPQTLDDLKKLLEKLDASESNTYKSTAYLAEVPAAERLLLLKTLAKDTKKYMNALLDTKQVLEKNTKLTTEQHKTITEFIDNVSLNVNLNGKIIQRLDEPRKRLSNLEKKPIKNQKLYSTTKDSETATSAGNGVKLTRDQIINQLIKNRILYYLRMKEASGESKGNTNFNLATKILFYLETGNDNLARQLFKLFVLQNKTKTGNSSIQVTDSGKYEIMNQRMPDRRLKYKVPLIQFEEPKTNKVVSLPNQDQLIKQLLNMKT